MDLIDKIFVINLDYRKDRRQDISKQFERLKLPFDKIEFFSAIENKFMGCIGCNESHLAVYKLIKERGYKHTIILEDDFDFIIDREHFDRYMNHFFNYVQKKKWRVVMLAYGIGTVPVDIGDDMLALTEDSQNAAGYMVNGDAIDELIACLEYGTERLKRTGMHHLFVNDQIWKSLQKDKSWYIFTPRFGEQRLSYSDLSQKVVKNL